MRDRERKREREGERKRDGDSESWRERKWKLRKEGPSHEGGGWVFSQLLEIRQPLTRR